MLVKSHITWMWYASKISPPATAFYCTVIQWKTPLPTWNKITQLSPHILHNCSPWKKMRSSPTPLKLIVWCWVWPRCSMWLLHAQQSQPWASWPTTQTLISRYLIINVHSINTLSLTWSSNWLPAWRIMQCWVKYISCNHDFKLASSLKNYAMLSEIHQLQSWF